MCRNPGQGDAVQDDTGTRGYDDTGKMINGR